MSISYIVFSVVLTAVIVSDAYAYIDPATGSAIMSLIVGLFVGAGVIIKIFWYKIISFFGLSKKSNSKSEKKQDE